jgi:hypothetical protein
MGPVSLVRNEPVRGLYRYYSWDASPGLIPVVQCESGRVVWGCSSNLLLRTVAHVPNLGNDGNRLVRVDHTFTFIWFLGVYFLPCISGLPCKDINRSIIGHSPLSESAWPLATPCIYGIVGLILLSFSIVCTTYLFSTGAHLEWLTY